MANNSFSDSRVWFVTGSSSGLGKALVEGLLAANERVVATLRKPSALAELQSKYSAAQLLIQPLDVTTPSQISDAFEATKKHFGRLDVVVNNAGYGLLCEIEGTPDEEARKQVEVLFWGPVNITKHAIKFFRDVNPAGYGGRVLNITSLGGYQAGPGLAFYSVGKFALEAFTEAFTKEMPPSWNIKGVIIEPGGFRTEWGGSGMVNLPQPPEYADPSTPSSIFRSLMTSLEGKAFGDPAKAAKVMMTIAGEPNPPLRLQLGTDSLQMVRAQARQTIADSEKWEALSESTNADDCDLNIMQKIASVKASE